MITYTAIPELTDNQHLIFAEHMGALDHKVELANRKLARNDITGRFSYDVVGQVVTEAEGIVTVRNIIEMNVPTIGLDGVRFIGSVEVEEGGTILRMVPGEETPEGFERPDSHNCDHCGTRRDRVKSYLVREADGSIKQIGSSCLELYFGVKVRGLWVLGAFTADDLRAMAEEADERDGYSGGGRVSAFSVRHLIALALVISNGGKGFVSKGAARDREWLIATADDVMNTITFRPGRDQSLNAEMAARQQAAAEVADADIDAVLTFADTLSGDYGMNAQAAARSNHIGYRSTGVLISLVGVWYRAQEKAAAAATERATVLNEFVGEPKQRLRGLVLTVRTVREIEGDYGISTLLVMRDAEGHTFKWFSSSVYGVDAGDVLTLDATVKGHEEYEGTKQTVITRGKVHASVKADDAA